jgi:phosphoglycerol geranylgeranyltransferase
MVAKVYQMIKDSSRGVFSILIDPDKYPHEKLVQTLLHAIKCDVDLVLLGGSLVNSSIVDTMSVIRNTVDIPVALFPGSVLQFIPQADAIFLLSLISGRNPEFLIGNHVVVAPQLKASGMEIIPTGYMLIESGIISSVQYMSNTQPIPRNKTDIAVATAIAGEQLGLKAIYLEAGSGALNPVSQEMISEVVKNISIPIIVGGGLRTPSQVADAAKAGASMVVVGNAIEDDERGLALMVEAFRKNLVIG